MERFLRRIGVFFVGRRTSFKKVIRRRAIVAHDATALRMAMQRLVIF